MTQDNRPPGPISKNSTLGVFYRGSCSHALIVGVCLRYLVCQSVHRRDGVHGRLSYLLPKSPSP